MSLYAVLLCTALYFLFSYDRVNIHLEINKTVGNRLIDAFFYYITYLGDGTVAVILLLMILVFNIRLGLYATSSFLTASLFSITLKHLFFDDENRPMFIFSYIDKQPVKLVEGVEMFIHNSFPSGHATQAFSIFMCLVFVSKNHSYKYFFFCLALFTAFSRVYLSQHWLADITAGSAIGMFFSIVYYFLFIQKSNLEKLNKPIFAFKTH